MLTPYSAQPSISPHFVAKFLAVIVSYGAVFQSLVPYAVKNHSIQTNLHLLKLKSGDKSFILYN
jgi:hypothetical protein